jgi:hypothetical protein
LRGRLKVNGLPPVFLDGRANLGSAFALLLLQVGEVKFLQTGGTMSSVGGFVTTAKASVTDAVAITIAGKLVQKVRDPGRKFIRVDLVVTLERRSDELFLGKYWRQTRTLFGRSVMVSGNL